MLAVRSAVAVSGLPDDDSAVRPRVEQPMTELHGDLVARLRWLGEHDRASLLGVLATVEPRALVLALRLAAPEAPQAGTRTGLDPPARQSARANGCDAPKAAEHARERPS